MTDVTREESETGRFSYWVFVKNWISDYLKTTELNIDGSKNVGVNVKTITEEEPTASTKLNASYAFTYNGDGRLQYIYILTDVTTYRKALTYTSGKLSSISVWVET